jgi:hypothetical protein
MEQYQPTEGALILFLIWSDTTRRGGPDGVVANKPVQRGHALL